MIQFRKLVLENFLSYKDKTVVPLSGQGIVRIEGKNEDDAGAVSNMAGKSAIMEALLWVLFGKTLRGVKHNAVVNRRAKRNCKVSVQFAVEDGSEFRVFRYRKDKKRSNGLRIFRDSRELSFRHGVDTQSKIESILGCDFAAFVNSTVFGGFDGTRKQFALLTDSDQKRILDSFLRFERFELAQDRAKHLLHKAQQEVTETTLAIAEAEGKVNLYKEKAATLQASAKVFQDRERNDRRKLKKQLRAIELPNPDKYVKEIERAEEQVENFSTKLNRAKVNSDAAHRSLNKSHQQIRNWKSLADKTCPTCGRRLSPRDGERIIGHLRADRRNLKSQLNESDALVAKYKRRLYGSSQYLKDLQKKHTKRTVRLREFQAKRRALKERLRELSGAHSLPFSSLYEEAKMEYGRSLSRLLVLRQKNIELSKKVKALEFWEVGFGNSGVKTLVMREILPAMNRKLKEYAAQVFQSPVELEFRPSKKTKKGAERELFHLHYQSKLNSSSYLGESSGGRRRIDICVLLVFSWLARAANILLVDELLDGLDDAGRESVLNILAGQRGTVLVISHERELKNRIGKVWTVTKKNGISHLEMAA